MVQASSWDLAMQIFGTIVFLIVCSFVVIQSIVGAINDSKLSKLDWKVIDLASKLEYAKEAEKLQEETIKDLSERILDLELKNGNEKETK